MGLFQKTQSNMLVVWLLCFLAFICYNPVESSACPGGYSYQSGDICYAYVNDKKTWAEAEAMCKALGGYLVEVHSVQENDYLEKIVFEHRDPNVWMGAHDILTEGQWFWATSGEPVAEFTFWGAGEPNNNHVGGQDCMNFRYESGHWDDAEC